MTKLIDQLARHRQQKDLSQRQLAALAGLDPKTISLWERGERSPTLLALIMVSAAMQFDLAQKLKEVMNDE